MRSHGKASTYNVGCRCSECKSAHYEQSSLSNLRTGRTKSRRGERVPLSDEERRRRQRERNKEQKRRQRSTPEYKLRQRAKRYGLTPERLAELLTDARCAICGGDEPRHPNGAWSIDHDHACCPTLGSRGGKRACGECVRGVLCHSCNVMLGASRDTPSILRAAADYLERPTLRLVAA